MKIKRFSATKVLLFLQAIFALKIFVLTIIYRIGLLFKHCTNGRIVNVEIKTSKRVA